MLCRSFMSSFFPKNPFQQVTTHFESRTECQQKKMENQNYVEPQHETSTLL